MRPRGLLPLARVFTHLEKSGASGVHLCCPRPQAPASQQLNAVGNVSNADLEKPTRSGRCWYAVFQCCVDNVLPCSMCISSCLPQDLPLLPDPAIPCHSVLYMTVGTSIAAAVNPGDAFSSQPLVKDCQCVVSYTLRGLASPLRGA